MKNKKKEIQANGENINRKEALKKVGRYSAFTAVAMMVILNPNSSQAQVTSPVGPRG
jgi:hypothetical protein